MRLVLRQFCVFAVAPMSEGFLTAHDGDESALVDVEVERPLAETAAGTDVQLECAVRELLAAQ
jgi:hypothetical protein